MAGIIERRKPGLYRIRNNENHFVGKIQQIGPSSWIYDNYRTDEIRKYERLRDARKDALSDLSEGDRKARKKT